MQIEFQTDVGQKRKSNQDAVDVFLNEKDIKLAIVADGMGGHKAGDVASKMAVADIGAKWQASKLQQHEDIIKWLLHTIQIENEIIYEHGETDPLFSGMGTTIVAAVVMDDTILLAHVGDSRCYLIRDGEIKQLTEDHSLVRELLKSGEITAEMAENHPRKNVLVRSVGMPGTVEVDVSEYDVLPNDKYLICSDGLTNMVSNQRIKEILETEENNQEKLNQLILEANKAGGTDNITVLLVDYSEESGGE